MKIIKFSALWCEPCKVYKPMFKKWADNTDIEIEEIDVEKEPEIAGKFRVMSVPTTILLDDDGSLLRHFSGVMNEDELNTFATK